MAKKEESILGVYIEDNFDVEGLIELGFLQTKVPGQPNNISSREDYEAIAQRVCHFFGLKRIYDYTKLQPYGPGLETEAEKQVTDIVSTKDWLLDGNRLVNLIENN